MANLGQRPRNPIAQTSNPESFRGQSIQRGFSIPNVPLIEINAMPARQLAVFLLKRPRPMMLSLRLDVLQHGIELARA